VGNRPLISIITPTYNHERFIKHCIESVLSQTYKNWEMIIVDDGSTDNTVSIIEEYKDERIHLIKQKHRGIWKLGKTYNRALRFSDGELIAILEGDDFWPQYKLEIQQKGFKNKDVVLTWGKAYLYYDGQILGVIPRRIDLSKMNSGTYYLQRLLLKNYLPAVTVMVKREALDSIGGFRQRLGAPYIDYTTWLELSLIGEFRFVNKVLGYWRKHSKQTTNVKKLELVRASKKVSLDFIEKNYHKLKNMGINVEYTIKRIYKDYDKAIAAAYFVKSVSTADKERIQFYLDEALFRGNITIKVRSLLLKKLKRVPQSIILPKLYYKL